MQPFIKWVGGKRNLIPIIKDMWPEEIGTYYEPFLGGAAVFLEFLPEKAVLSDLNVELINFYDVLAYGGGWDALAEILKNMGNTKEKFEEIRAWDREDGYFDRSPEARAARFLFLNKTAYNGLWRVNSKGQFNAPFGYYDKPMLYTDTFREFREEMNLREVTFCACDYKSTMALAGEGDLVFLDPPYYPTSRTANFASYNSGGFGPTQHEELAWWCRQLDKKGAKFILTNSFTEETKKLYFDFKVQLIDTNRSMDRGQVTHIIVRNY